MKLLSGIKTMRTTAFTSFAFLLLFRKVDVSDIAQSRSAKLQQNLKIQADEQQPLSVHLLVKKCWNCS